MAVSGPQLDKNALRRKYQEERDKRLRDDGNDQYRKIGGVFAHYDIDPYTPVAAREPRRDHVTFAFVGGGFGGLSMGARLAQAGIEDVRIIEKGGDFGGTWYWNRYPGAQCDVASFVYMPLCEETGYMPTEKYARGPEIQEHAKRIGRQFKLYDQALFHTELRELTWDEAKSIWRIRTNRGDDFTAQFVGVGTGGLHVPKLPGIPGIEDFRGQSFHTSRWNYDYTGGDASGEPMHKLSDKRIAVIGTGATAVQVVPRVAEFAKQVFVFQRTASSVDVRNNAPTDPTWFEKEISKPGWQKQWIDNFTANVGFGAPPPTEDLVRDGWTDLSARIKSKIMSLPPEERRDPSKWPAVLEDADNEKMDEIRARVDSVVEDKATASDLKAWYRQLCKRPCFHDEYLQSFNNPAVQLIDTNGKGVEKITATAVVAAGRSYEVDCIVYASGFEVGTPQHDRTGFDPIGRGGLRLSEHWSGGMRTMHGIHTHGFPNLFYVQPTQGANLISNVPAGLDDAAQTIASIVRHALDHDQAQVEVSREAEEKWVQLIRSGAKGMLNNTNCTPGYYNGEGKGYENFESFAGYPYGQYAFFQYIAKWRSSGKFKGLTFSQPGQRSKL